MQHLAECTPTRHALCHRLLTSWTWLQEDISLGEPDWAEVTNTTSLDLLQLLPTRQDLVELIGDLEGKERDEGEVEAMLAEAKKQADALTAAACHDRGDGVTGRSNAVTFDTGTSEDQGPVAAGLKAAEEGSAARVMPPADEKKAAQESQPRQANRKKESRKKRKMELYHTFHSADALLRVYQACTPPMTSRCTGHEACLSLTPALPGAGTCRSGAAKRSRRGVCCKT